MCARSTKQLNPGVVMKYDLDKSSVHGRVQRICQGLAKQITAATIGAAFILAPFAATTAKADETKATQFQYLQYLIALTGNNPSLPPNPTPADYINLATSKGINPKDGWKLNDNLNRDTLAYTL